MPRVALVAASAIVDRLRIVAVADVCPAADRACVNFHHVPLVAAATPPDLSDRAKHLLDSAKCGRKPPEYRPTAMPPSSSSAIRPPGRSNIAVPNAKTALLECG